MKKFKKVIEFVAILAVLIIISMADFLYMNYIVERPEIGTNDYYDFGLNTFNFLLTVILPANIIYSSILFFAHSLLCRVTKNTLSWRHLVIFTLVSMLLPDIASWDFLISFAVFVLLDLFFLKKFPVKK